MTAVLPFGVVNSRGQGSGVIATAKAPPEAARKRSPTAIFVRIDLMSVLLSLQYASRRPEAASPMPAPHSPPSVSRRRMLLSAERATEALSRHGRTRVAWVDVFAMGDAEKIVPGLADVLRRDLSREATLAALADLKGLYVPAVHGARAEGAEDGKIVVQQFKAAEGALREPP